MLAQLRTLSLWDLMHHFNASELFRALGAFSVFEMACDDQTKLGNCLGVPTDNHRELLRHAEAAGRELRALDCTMSLECAEIIAGILRDEVQDNGRVFKGMIIKEWSALNTSKLATWTLQLRSRVGSELRGKFLLSLSRADQVFYEQQISLFGEEVEAAFPSAIYDIEEAGKCRAVARWTACVMHMMRALEVGLDVLEQAVGVDVIKGSWNGKLDQIDAAIKRRTKAEYGAADEQWYAEASTHFRVLKNAWRNHAQHGKDHYDQERATAIFDSVRSFMRHLATRLAEQTIS
ncbi:hypothetical protein [Sphingomonas sp.]|uniref:hypothetical protein n=1 Tax=Sphingomonas sp. TaxID=28214 RepID=UPI0035BC75D5